MGQILHKLARTTAIERHEIQNSNETISALSRKYGVSRVTIYRWKKSDSGVCDKSTKPHKTRTVLTDIEQQIIVEFRRKTLLPLDDIFIALKEKRTK